MATASQITVDELERRASRGEDFHHRLPNEEFATLGIRGAF